MKRLYNYRLKLIWKLITMFSYNTIWTFIKNKIVSPKQSCECMNAVFIGPTSMFSYSAILCYWLSVENVYHMIHIHTVYLITACYYYASFFLINSPLIIHSNIESWWLMQHLYTYFCFGVFQPREGETRPFELTVERLEEALTKAHDEVLYIGLLENFVYKGQK